MLSGEARLRYGVEPLPGRFLVRLNRFAVEVEAGGRRERAHLPNSGRLTELLVPGVPCLLLPVRFAGSVRGDRVGPCGGRRQERRTPHDLVAVRHGGFWVSVDARLPALLVAEAVGAGRLRPFAGWRVARREPAGPRAGRFDLELVEPGTGRRCMVETKSVTLVVGGEARFPDAPTERGRRHVVELARLAEAGDRACVCFVAQRPDARWFSPNAATDPGFTAALAEAVTAGVEVYAWRCCTSAAGVIIREEIPVREVG